MLALFTEVLAAEYEPATMTSVSPDYATVIACAMLLKAFTPYVSPVRDAVPSSSNPSDTVSPRLYPGGGESAVIFQLSFTYSSDPLRACAAPVAPWSANSGTPSGSCRRPAVGFHPTIPEISRHKVLDLIRRAPSGTPD